MPTLEMHNPSLTTHGEYLRALDKYDGESGDDKRSYVPYKYLLLGQEPALQAAEQTMGFNSLNLQMALI